MSDFVLQTGVAWLLVLAAAVMLLELGAPALVASTRAAALRGRVLRVVMMCWMPIVIATVLVVGCYMPWALARFGWINDHCETHGGHVHLCVEHVHDAAASSAAWLLFFAVAVWLTRGLVEVVRGVRRGHLMRRELNVLEGEQHDDVCVVDAELPLSLTIGLWSARIFVTRGLLDALSPVQRQVMLEHERCHVRERHALLKLAGALGALVWRKETRRNLLELVALACERRGDEAAAAHVGDRLEVATTLLAGRRALREAELHGVLGLGSSDLETRVRLLAASRQRDERTPVALVLAVLTIGLFAGHGLHHGLETVLSVFLS